MVTGFNCIGCSRREMHGIESSRELLSFKRTSGKTAIHACRILSYQGNHRCRTAHLVRKRATRNHGPRPDRPSGWRDATRVHRSGAGAPSVANTNGTRTEHVSFGSGKTSDVTRVEPPGDQARLHVKLVGHGIIALTGVHTPLESGDQVAIEPRNPHYFDEGGIRIA